MLGACYRRKVLKGIGQVQRNFSRLFKFKLSLYCALVFLDLGTLILACIQVFKPYERIFYAAILKDKKLHLFHDANRGLLITLIFGRFTNLVVYAISAVILYKEYVRLVSEAWYSHKLFIWSNLVLHTVHVAVFWDFHAETLALLALGKCTCLLLITICQFMT